MVYSIYYKVYQPKVLQSISNEDIIRQKRKIKDELEIDEARIQAIKKDI